MIKTFYTFEIKCEICSKKNIEIHVEKKRFRRQNFFWNKKNEHYHQNITWMKNTYKIFVQKIEIERFKNNAQLYFINNIIIKSQYLMHCINEIINILMKNKLKIYFSNDANVKYWIIITKKNVYKIEFIIFYKQWTYLKIKIKLTSVLHTYAQFINLIFELLSLTKKKNS